MRDSLRKRVEALEAKRPSAKTVIIGGFLLSQAEIGRMVREVDGRTRGIPKPNVTVYTWLPVQ